MTDDITDYESEELRLTAQGWSPYLAKAACDPFTYAIGLRTGLVLLCEEVKELPNAPGWVRIAGISGSTVRAVPNDVSLVPPSFERGLDVRVADIVWVADAPFGS